FVTTYFNELVSLMIFVVAFSMIFTVMPTWSDNINVNAIIALSIALVLAGANYTNSDFSNILYNFLFAVPYGLAVLLLLLIIINILFNPKKNIKIITSILLAAIFVIILLSGDIISVEAPAQEGSEINLIVFFTILIILAIIVVAFLVRKFVKSGKKTPRTGKPFTQRLFQGRRERIETIENEIKELVEKEGKNSLVGQFSNFLSNYNDKRVLYNFLFELSELLKRDEYRNILNRIEDEKNIILEHFKKVYNNITGIAMRVNRRRVLLTYYWAVFLEDYNALLEINIWKDFNRKIVEYKTSELNKIKEELFPEAVEIQELPEEEEVEAESNEIISFENVPLKKWSISGSFCGYASIVMGLEYLWDKVKEKLGFKGNFSDFVNFIYEKIPDGGVYENEGYTREYLLIIYITFILREKLNKDFKTKFASFDSFFKEVKNEGISGYFSKDKGWLYPNLITNFLSWFGFSDYLINFDTKIDLKSYINSLRQIEEKRDVLQKSDFIFLNVNYGKTDKKLSGFNPNHFTVLKRIVKEDDFYRFETNDPSGREVSYYIIYTLDCFKLENELKKGLKNLIKETSELTEEQETTLLFSFDNLLKSRKGFVDSAKKVLIEMINKLIFLKDIKKVHFIVNNKQIETVDAEIEENDLYIYLKKVTDFKKIEKELKKKLVESHQKEAPEKITLPIYEGEIIIGFSPIFPENFDKQTFKKWILKIIQKHKQEIGFLKYVNIDFERVISLSTAKISGVSMFITINQVSDMKKIVGDVLGDLSSRSYITLVSREEETYLQEEDELKETARENFTRKGADENVFDLIWNEFSRIHDKIIAKKDYSTNLESSKNIVISSLLKDDELELSNNAFEELIELDKKIIEERMNKYKFSNWKILWAKLGVLFKDTFKENAETLILKTEKRTFDKSDILDEKVLKSLDKNKNYLIYDKKQKYVFLQKTAKHRLQFFKYVFKNGSNIYNKENLNELPKYIIDFIFQKINEKKIHFLIIPETELDFMYVGITELGRVESSITMRSAQLLLSESYKIKLSGKAPTTFQAKEIEKFKKELPEQEIISLPSEQDKTESGEEKGHVCESLLQVELFKILSEGRKDVKNSAFNYFSAENNSENDFEEAWEIYEIGLGKVRSKKIVPKQYSAKNLHKFIPHTDTKKILDAYGNVFARNLLTYVYNIYLAENSIYRLLANNKKIFDELDESIKEGIEERLTSWQFNWSECAKLFKNKTKEEDENKGGKPLAPSGSKMQSLKHSSPAFVEKVEGEKEEFDNEFGNTQIGKRTLSAWQGFAKNSERKADRNTYSAFYNEVTNNLKNKMAETAFMKKLMQISEYFLKIDLNTPDKFFHNSPEINYPAKIRYEIKNGKKTIYCLNQTTHENAKITPDLLSKRNDNLYNYLCINLARIINFEKFKKVLAEIRIEQMPIGMSFKISEEEKKDYTRIIREALADLIRKNKFVKEILYLDSIHIIWEENYVFYNKNVLNIGFRHFEPPFDYALFKELIVEAFENPEKKAGYNEKSIMEKVEDAVEGLNQEK
ncbi:hypothetical protein COS64_00865, partial [archaeon CG06_land_8_20_14_3_00_37_11]